jgi:hypothetical protein
MCGDTPVRVTPPKIQLSFSFGTKRARLTDKKSRQKTQSEIVSRTAPPAAVF